MKKSQQEFDAMTAKQQADFLANNGEIIIETTQEEAKQEEIADEEVIDATEIKGKDLYYLSRRPMQIAYGARNKQAKLKSAEEGGMEGQFYYQCLYKGVGFAVNINEPFIKDLDARNLGEVTLQRTKAGYDLLGYVPKDALLADTKENLAMDIMKAKANFAKQAFKPENFTFDAQFFNETIGL